MRKYILLFFLGVIALSFRLYRLDARGLITDEKFTLLNANGFWVGGANQSAFKKTYFTAQDFWEKKGPQDFMDASANADFGTHMVHNVILHYWMKVFGNSDFSVRMPGLIFNVLTVLLIYLLVLKYFRSYSMAFLAGLLFAIDPLNIAQSHIARSYPLSFFLITLATAYFVKLVSGENSKKNFVIYAVIIGLAMLNHYMNFFVPLLHVLIFLVIRNKRHLWTGFILAALANALLLFYWFNWGGGKGAMGFLKDKNEIHKKIAENLQDELSQTIQLASPDVIAKKGIALYYDISVITHGLFEDIKGVKVFLSSLLLAIGILLSVQGHKYKRYAGLILSLLILALERNYLGSILASAALFVAFYYAVKYLLETRRYEAEKQEFLWLCMGLGMLILPLIFVVRDAYLSGNTTSLTHRYIGNASPFVVILVSIGVIRAAQEKVILGALMLFLMIFQWTNIQKGIQDYFADRSVYNAYFVPERVPNPYAALAKEIQEKAALGDTLVIPGAYRDKYEERFDKGGTVSFKDAQFLNLYFPKDYALIQYVDPKERERLYLKKKDGERVLLFDFKGEEYRY